MPRPGQLMIDSVRLAQQACARVPRGKPGRTATSGGGFHRLLRCDTARWFRISWRLRPDRRTTHRLAPAAFRHLGSQRRAICWSAKPFHVLRGSQRLVRLAAEYPEMPVWLSFSCKDKSRVCHGEPLAECVALTRGQPNVVAAGINCTAPRLIEPLLRSLVGATDCPLLVYPNSGERWDAENTAGLVPMPPCTIGASCAFGIRPGQAHRWLLPDDAGRHSANCRAGQVASVVITLQRDVSRGTGGSPVQKQASRLHHDHHAGA